MTHLGHVQGAIGTGVTGNHYFCHRLLFETSTVCPDSRGRDADPHLDEMGVQEFGDRFFVPEGAVIKPYFTDR